MVKKGPARTGRYGEGRGGRGSSPWVMRIVVIVASAVVLAALVYAAANGVLFRVNSH
ncbi:MAG: hypothetical protein HIU86_09950 [Acidobacteria bacterium]|nr:hypothetical protein [Acidobacteriota bacterium]